VASLDLKLALGFVSGGDPRQRHEESLLSRIWTVGDRELVEPALGL
jgi:hypothetical protein